MPPNLAQGGDKAQAMSVLKATGTPIGVNSWFKPVESQAQQDAYANSETMSGGPETNSQENLANLMYRKAQQMGYTGPLWDRATSDSSPNKVSSEYIDWIKNNGLTLSGSPYADPSGNGGVSAHFSDQSGARVAQEDYATDDSAMLYAALAGIGGVAGPALFGGAAAGATGIGTGLSPEAASVVAGTSDIGIGGAAAGGGGSAAGALGIEGATYAMPGAEGGMGLSNVGAVGAGDVAPAAFNAAADSQLASAAAGYAPASMGAGVTAPAVGYGLGGTATLAEVAGGAGLGSVGGGSSMAAPGYTTAAADSQAASAAAGYSPASMGVGAPSAVDLGSLGGVMSTGASSLGGWAQLATKIGGTIIGGALQGKAAGAAGNAASGAVAKANAASAEQVAFNKGQVAAQAPAIAKLGAAADTANTLNQKTASNSADRSAAAWQQNQQATQGSVGQMGINALGAQYLNGDQTKQLIALQAQLANGTPEQKVQAQAQIAEMQKTAEASGIGLEQAKAAAITGTTATQAGQVNQAYGTNAAATKQVGADTATGLASVAAKSGAQESALGTATGQTAVGNAGTIAGQQLGLGDAMAKSAIGDAGIVSDRQLEIGKTNAASTLADAQTTAGQLTATGDARRADQTGFYGAQAQTQRDVAHQRAAANELRANTQANADIANSADQSQRQLLRLGGDPNRMAAMAAEIAQKQQLARIGSGNQVAGTNIANLNAADDAARGLERTGFDQGTGQQYALQNQAQTVKSSALDSARAILTQTQQGALGATAAGLSEARGARAGAGSAAISTNAAGLETARTAQLAGDQSAITLGNTAGNQGVAAVAGANQAAADKTLAGNTAAQGVQFAGQNQATAISNAAKDKVDANLNSLQAGTANYGAGFANTASQNDQNATYAGATGVSGLNTAAQSTVPMTNTVNGAYGNAVNAAGVGNTASGNILAAGNSGASAASGTAGVVAGQIPELVKNAPAIGSAIGSAYDYIISTKKAKTGRQPVDADAALAGLEDALPQSYRYKPGMGPPGRKIGAMAEDMHAQFGDETAPGGKAISIQNSIGLQHAAIVALSRKVKQLQSKRD